jgi:hypothetical protein
VGIRKRGKLLFCESEILAETAMAATILNQCVIFAAAASPLTFRRFGEGADWVAQD